VIPLEIVVRVPEPGLASDLEGLTNLTAAVRDVDGIGRVVAPQEFVPPAFGTSPAVWHRMSVMEGPSRYVREREGGLVFRISAGGYIQGSDGLSRVVSEVRQLAHDTFGDRAAITGLMPVFARTMDHIVGSQLTSFAIAVTAVALLFLLLAPSGRIGVMAVTANVLPILLVLGGMGWMGLPIDFGTAMIASVLIGIAVHDTVHVLFGLRRERARGASVREALATTFDVVGPPVVASTVVFCGGLLVLVFSDFAPVRHFGLLSCAVMVAALLADLILLPALVAAPAGGS
jgi:predicted RND superfamily exporter protein